MICNNCKNENAWHLVSRYDSGKGISTDCCDACGLEGSGDGIPDVYLAYAGQKFENLTDKMGNPIEIRSKRHKAEVMKQLGVSEAGDRVHGAAYGQGANWIDSTRDWRRKQFDKERPMIRETWRKWKEGKK